MRAVVPVRDGGAAVVALVSVGITVERRQRARSRRSCRRWRWPCARGWRCRPAGAWLVSRRLRRQTHGLGAREITRMYEYYDAVLHAVREGLLLLDGDGRVQLVNDEARRLLGLPDDVVGRLGRRARPAAGRSTRPLVGGTAEAGRHLPRRRARPGRQPGPGARGRAARSAPWSPCATTPSCGRSPASWTRCAA